MSDLQENISIILQVVDKTNNHLKKFSGDVKEVGNQSEKASAKTKKASDGIDKAGKSAQKATPKTKELARAVQESTGNFGDLIGKLSQFAATLAAIGYPVVQAAAFERKMGEVKAITGATNDTLARMSETAKTLGRETEFSATEAAEGMKMLSMAGLSAEEAIQALPGALNLAQAGAIGLGESADFATNIMGGMGLEVKDLNHIVDTLANTATSSNSNVTELAEAMSYAAPAAAAAGVSLEETAAVMGVLHDNGIKASRAGTGVKTMLTRLLAPTPKAQAALDKLGVTVSKNADGSLNLTKTLEDLGKAEMGVSEASSIFGAYAMGAALAASKQTENMRDLTSENEHASDVMDGYNGAAEKMAATMNDNVVGSWRNFLSAVNGTAITLGTYFLPILKQVLDTLTAMMNGITALAEEYPKWTQAIVYLTGAFVVYRTAVTAARIANILFSKSLFNLAMPAGLSGTALKTLTSIVSALKAQLLTSVTAVKTLGAAVSIVAGVVTAAFAGWTFGTWLSEEFESVKKAGIDMARVITIACLRVKQALAWLIPGGDSASDVQKEIDTAKKIYTEMYNEVGAGAEDAGKQAATAQEEITNKTKEEAAKQLETTKKLVDEQAKLYDELNEKVGTGEGTKKGEKEDEFGLTPSERASIDEEIKKLDESRTNRSVTKDGVTTITNVEESNASKVTGGNNSIAQIGETYANFTSSMAKTIESVTKASMPKGANSLIQDSIIGANQSGTSSSNGSQKSSEEAVGKVVELRLGSASIKDSEASVNSFLDELEQHGATA